MPYGGVNFIYLAGGRTTTSAASAHNLFGNYGGLSNLNANDTIQVLLSASGGDIRLSLDPTTAASENTSLRVMAAASLVTLPVMKVSNASQITFSREGVANNPVVFWTILSQG